MGGEAVLSAFIFTPGFTEAVPGPAEGSYTQSHAFVVGTEGAVSGEEEPELAAIQASSASQIS